MADVGRELGGEDPAATAQVGQGPLRRDQREHGVGGEVLAVELVADRLPLLGGIGEEGVGVLVFVEDELLQTQLVLRECRPVLRFLAGDQPELTLPLFELIQDDLVEVGRALASAADPCLVGKDFQVSRHRGLG